MFLHQLENQVLSDTLRCRCQYDVSANNRHLELSSLLPVPQAKSMHRALHPKQTTQIHLAAPEDRQARRHTQYTPNTIDAHCSTLRDVQLRNSNLPELTWNLALAQRHTELAHRMNVLRLHDAFVVFRICQSTP